MKLWNIHEVQYYAALKKVMQIDRNRYRMRSKIHFFKAKYWFALYGTISVHKNDGGHLYSYIFVTALNTYEKIHRKIMTVVAMGVEVMFL